MRYKIWLISVLLCCISPLMAKVHIIAAENNYGAIAKIIGGDAVQVTSIMNNPNQDPHAFTVSPKIHTLLNTLGPHDMFIVNGAGYDAWATVLIPHTQAHIINVAELNQVRDGENPHLWYDLKKINKLAELLAAQLSMSEPSQQAVFAENLKRFLQHTHKIQQVIQVLRKKYAHNPVAATESVAYYLTNNLELDVHAQSFQQHILNGTEPSVQERMDFLNEIDQHKIRLIIYNHQVSNPVTKKILMAAQTARIPVVGVNELLSADTENFLDAYEATVNQIKEALLK